MVPYRGRVWTETFARGAFPGIEDLPPGSIEVRLGHEGPAIGKVMRFDPDSALGLVAEVAVQPGPLGDQVLTDADRGRLSASVGFRTSLDNLVLDHDARTRVVTAALLDHIALTGDPAYSTARVLATRSAWRPENDPIMVWAEMRRDPLYRWARRRLAGR